MRRSHLVMRAALAVSILACLSLPVSGCTEIVSAQSLTGTPLKGFALSSRKTVEQLFDAARPPYADWVGDVVFDFDTELGYPRRVNLTSKPGIADAGAVYEARNLKPITP